MIIGKATLREILEVMVVLDWIMMIFLALIFGVNVLIWLNTKRILRDNGHLWKQLEKISGDMPH